MFRNKPATLILSLLLAGVTVGTAYAVARDDGSRVKSADEVYTPGMSLDEISKLSQGQPGTVAPPCPDVATVTKLKEAGLPIGPCDPLPEQGAPVLIPKPGEVKSDGAPDEPLCGTMTSGYPGLAVRFPCGVGLHVIGVEYPIVGNERCAEATYIPGVGKREVTEILCPSSPNETNRADLVPAAEHSHEGGAELSGSSRWSLWRWAL